MANATSINTIRTHSGKIEIFIDFDLTTIGDLKKAGATYRKKDRAWLMTDNAVNRAAVNSIQPGSFKIDTITPDKDFRPLDCAMSHQVDGMRIAWKRRSWGFWYGTGSGKTLMALDIIRMYNVKTLVVGPLTGIKSAWLDDIEKFGFDFEPVVNLWAARKRKKTYQEKLDKCKVGIINFDGFKSEFERLKAAGFKLAILDESSAYKNHDTKITKLMTEFCSDLPGKYLFSGLPAPNNELEYFSQCKMIDPSVFGTSFWRFRSKYFNKTGFNYALKPEKKQEFADRLASISSTVKTEDVIDLPPKTDIIRSFDLSAAEQRRHDGAVRELLEQLENNKKLDGETAQQTAQLLKTAKQRQITSGFLYDENKNVEIIGKTKRRVFSELIDEIGNKQVIIWTQFRPEVEHITDILPENTYGLCNGMVSNKIQEAAIADFKSGKNQYLVAHPGSMKYAITLVNCQYAIYYSISHSYDDLKQSRDRIYRNGQTKKCFYYFLLATGSVDFKVLEALQKKQSVSEAVLNYIRQSKR